MYPEGKGGGHRFGDDFVLGNQLFTQFVESTIGFGLVGLHGSKCFESPFSLAHDGMDPVVDQRGLNLQLVSDFGNWNLVDQVSSPPNPCHWAPHASSSWPWF